MRSIKHLALLALALPLTAGAGGYLRYSIGGTPIVLAYPDGYVELCSANRSVAETFKTSIPAENSLLGCYTTPKDLEELNNAAGGVFSSYLMTSIVRGTLRGGTTQEAYSQFKSQFKQVVDQEYEKLQPDIKKRLKEASDTMSKQQSTPVKVELNESVPLGVFDKSDRHLSSAWLAKSTYSIGDSKTTSTQVQISTSVLSSGKVYVLATYGEYTGNADIEKYKNVAKSWTKVFMQENP